MSVYLFPAHKRDIQVLDDLRTERGESTHQRAMWSIPGRLWRLEHRLPDVEAHRTFYMEHRTRFFEYEGHDVLFADVPVYEHLGGGWWSVKVVLEA